ncbi:MAG: type I secretion protein TolC, partial [Alphaproteobacteria bacterium]|nr:type I secretion protein TolC [Alphaproteobacteria bacterium]
DLPATQEEAIRLAVAESPSIVAAAFTEEAARHGVRVAEATLYPTLGFSADWTRTDDAAQTQSTTRPGFVQSSGFLFTLTVPLYQSGSEYSTIRQAKQTVSQRRLQVEEARRTTIEAVTRAWEQLGTTRAVIGSRSEQVRAAEFALEGVREEANVGSRTTLDVLNSEQELLDARVALVTSRRDENVANFNLRSAMGRLTVRHLGLSVAQYDPLRNYEEVRKSAFGAGAKD